MPEHDHRSAKDTTTNRGETYRELAQLHIIDPRHLFLLRDAESEAGDVVHGEEDEAGAAEGVDEVGERVRKLVAELDVVVVQPAAGDDGVAVEVGDVVAGLLRC